MASPLRHIPMTTLDELRAALGNHTEGDATSQARIYQLLQQLRQLALPELGARLVKGSTATGLKRFILGLTARYDWPEWTPWLFQALQQEPDLGVFDEGCAALARLEIRPAREALQRLATLRTDPDHQLILRRELGTLDAPQPLSFYLGRILEGESNPRLAHQGARGLATAAGAEAFPLLWGALEGADPLATRLLLRCLAELPGPAPGPALLDYFHETLQTLEDLQALEALAQRLQGGARSAARGELAQALAPRMEARAPEEIEALRAALDAGESGRPTGPLERLQELAKGPFERFLTEALTTLVEGKVARFNAMVAEALDQAGKQQLQRANNLNQICEGLIRQVASGGLTVGQVLPALEGAFVRRVQSQGLDYAFCLMVPPDHTDSLALILNLPDPKRRSRCLDVLGAREEDGFVPFFLQAMHDPIVEVGHNAVHQLGRLPSSFPVVMELFRSGQVDQIRTALRIFTENGTRLATEPLMEFLRADERDDLLLEGVEALGAIRNPLAAPVLLDLLHDGKPILLQEALVEALSALGTPEASLGLLGKAALLKLPQVLIAVLEGVLMGFPGFERPLPQGELPALEDLITRCCDDREGDGQRLRAMLATQHLYCFDQDLYLRLKETFSDFLFELRTKGDWDRETNDQVAAVVKELGRRSVSLGHIAGKEAKLRSLLQATPPAGPGRAPALLALREALDDPEFIMRAELAQELSTFAQNELARRDQDWRELARLCEIAGRTRQQELVEPLQELFSRATGLGLRSAAKEALLALGLAESDIGRHAPIRSILVLDPSAFFRKRLLATLGTAWEVREAGSRTEAAALLGEQPVDLLLSELADGEGDLRAWLKAQCENRHCRQVLLSTATRDIQPGERWLLGVLYKPYPPEQLLKALAP